MVNNKLIVRNVLFLYLRMFVIMGMSLYTMRIFLKTLGAEDYGLYNVVGGIIVMFSFLNGSLGGATSRFITFELGRSNHVRLNQIFNAALVVHIFIAIIIIALAETVGLWFFYNKMTIPPARMDASFWVYQISIFTMLVNMIQVPYNATIIAHENMKVYAYIGLVEALSKLGIVYMVMTFSIDRLVCYAILSCILQLGVMLFYVCYCHSQYAESRISICHDKKLYKDICSFAGSDLIGSVSVLAQGQGLNILLNMFFGPVVNAARGVAYQVQGAVGQFSNNFMTAVRPQIIKSYAEGQIEDMWGLVVRSSCFSYYLMLLICLPIFFETGTILSLWLGDYPEYTVSFIRLILVLCLIQTVKTPRVTIFHAMAKVFWSNITVGVVLCLAFPLAYLLLRLGYSPNSVFWASNFTMFLSEFVSIAVLRCFLKFSVFKYFMSVHGRCLLVSLTAFAVTYFLFDKLPYTGLVRLIMTCGISCLSVCLASLYLGMDKAMRQKLLMILKKHILKK